MVVPCGIGWLAALVGRDDFAGEWMPWHAAIW
jgi:hypothetical protein